MKGPKRTIREEMRQKIMQGNPRKRGAFSKPNRAGERNQGLRDSRKVQGRLTRGGAVSDGLGSEKVPRGSRRPREVVIGFVTHYFDKAHAAIVKLEHGACRVGDRIRFQSSKAELEITIESMQIDRAPIEQAKRGDEVGIEVKTAVRVGDKVIRLT